MHFSTRAASILLLATLAPLALAQESGSAPAATQPQSARSVDDILADIKALKDPVADKEKRADKEYMKQHSESVKKVQDQRAALTKELHAADPNHEELVKLYNARWSLLAYRDADTVLAETQAIIEAGKGEKLVPAAAYHRARTLGTKHEYDNEHYMAAVEQYLKLDPTSERGAGLLMSAASYGKQSDAEKKALFQRIAREFPEARTAKHAKGKLRQLDGLNKPFELEFQDAISGRTVAMKDLKGKVVVIDYWATWCGPCVAEMPHMKELYATYKDKGVEFIGVSLDNPEDKGGLTKLKDYCKENEVGWPQYYQGAGWDSEFSGSWGINAIPALFVVDAKGNLHSTSARGKLDTMIPTLLGLPVPEKAEKKSEQQ